MENSNSKTRINAKNFIDEFVRGLSEGDIREKFSISHSQFLRLIGILQANGQLTAELMEERRTNLKIRYGQTDGPQEGEKVAVDLSTGLVLHCPNCGASVKRDATNCEYCSAALDFSLKGKTLICPKCFSRTPADGRYCYRCAEPILGRIKEGLMIHDRICPKCDLPMFGLQIGDFSIIGCKQCGGAFVSHDVFEMMQAQADKILFPTDQIPRKETNPLDQKVHYVRCPVCRTMMNRTNFARISGVIIDTCRGHGIWFDPGEIERTMEFITKGGIQKAKEIEIQKLKDDEKLAQIRGMPISGDRSQYTGHWLAGEATLEGASSLNRLFRLVFED
jgi:Zn-finger nucleic acid-binding protein